jgi:hypothetical protein
MVTSQRKGRHGLNQGVGAVDICPKQKNGSDYAVLGIDTAAVSGAAVRIQGRLVMSCEVDTKRPEQVLHVVRYVSRVAKAANVPWVAVLERPWGGSTPVLVGLGMARERWLHALAAEGYARRRVVSVAPNTWRSVVLGSKWVRARRDDVRAHELATACASTGRSDIGPDEAAAIWISHWGACTPDVGARARHAR